MAQKAQVQSFTQSWTKTVDWAKQNGIPYNVYYPVYQLDAQRMLSGSEMSESDRVAAIQAAAGLNYSTALPTDAKDWLDPRRNITSNAEDIFTGLNPTHIIPNVLDTIKNTFTHPGNVLGALGDLFTGNTGAASRQILKPDNILQWVPGVYDLATLDTGNPKLSAGQNIRSGQGFEALAENPITSVLDILPFGRVTSEALGRTALGETAANRLNMSTEELRQAGIWRVGGKLIKTAPVPNILTKVTHPLLDYTTDPETGIRSSTGIKQMPTIGEAWEMMKQHLGADAETADITEANFKLDDEQTAMVKEHLEPLFESLRDLGPDGIAKLHQWAQSDFRPLEDKMADSNVPLPIRQAYEKAWRVSQFLEQLKMQAGGAERIRSPFNDTDADGKAIYNPDKPDVYETYHVDTTSYKNVDRALKQAEADQGLASEAMEPFVEALYKMQENDTNMIGVFKIIDQQRSAISESIKRSIPQEDRATVTERLRSTLPQGERWDRAVADQTPLIRNLLGLLPSEKLTLHMVNALRDLFAPGGLLDQANRAFQQQDWPALNKATKAAVRKFNSNSFKRIPTNGRAVLKQIKDVTENLQKYSSERQRMAEDVNKMATGYYRGSRSATLYKKSIAYLGQKALKSQNEWMQVAIHNPPDMWRNVGLDARTTALSQAEKTAESIEKSKGILSDQGMATLSDPRTLLELMHNSAQTTIENPMLPDIDHEEFNRVNEDMYQNLASLRAHGEAPLYVHMLSNRDIHDGLSPDYNVFIRGVKQRKMSSDFQRTWGYTPSVYDIGAGMLKSTKDMAEKFGRDNLVQQELRPRLFDAASVQHDITMWKRAEIEEIDRQRQAGVKTGDNALTVIDRGLKELGLKKFDPEAIFGSGFSYPGLDADYYIYENTEKAFVRTLNNYQFPADKIIDKGTQLFRFSILGLSPRYTAHILFGGGFLVALRANPSALAFIKPAWHFAVHNSFSDDTLKRFPDAPELIGRRATQEGADLPLYHYVQMRNAGKNWLIPEWLSNRKLPDTYATRIRAMADINMRFTRAINRFYTSMLYLDGAAKASKTGSMFYEDKFIARTDKAGNGVMHPVTQRQIYDTVRSKVPMTPAEAHNRGMQAVADAMGNLRHMTTLERSLLVRVFPFYGWTKHILQYVMSYPFDHPWRAMILGNLAMQDSLDTASGLPLRIQLLTFVGTPDKYGNVEAIDTKALNPLRDTANYASLAGLFESLNPAITSAAAMIFGPQASLGEQNLYPNVTFSTLYGTKEASSSANAWTAAEQFVPQLSAIDQAFNLSGQYAYLAKNGAEFNKKLFEALGLPFTPEPINVRQIAAQQELDRHSIAANAAYNYATGSDPGALQGYAANAELPDPLNTNYVVTPAYLQAMEGQSEQETGLPFYETGVPPPNPPI